MIKNDTSRIDQEILQQSPKTTIPDLALSLPKSETKPKVEVKAEAAKPVKRKAVMISYATPVQVKKVEQYLLQVANE